jgi:hypothetical protein
MWPCFVIPLVFLLMFPIVFTLERRRLRKASAAFLNGRSEMTEEDFLRRMEAQPDLTHFYVAGRQAMARLCSVPVAMIHPEDTVRSLLDLQFDNGFIDDFVFAMEIQVGGALPMGHPPEASTFAVYLKALAHHWQGLERIVLRLAASSQANRDFALQCALSELLMARSGGMIQVERSYPTADNTARLVWLQADRLEEALALVAEVVENVPAEGNDVRPALVVAVLRSGRYEVIYPRGFEGPFRI